MFINKSLMALSKVVGQLSTGSQLVIHSCPTYLLFLFSFCLSLSQQFSARNVSTQTNVMMMYVDISIYTNI